MRLALDEGFPRFALAIELLFEAFLGTLPSVDSESSFWPLVCSLGLLLDEREEGGKRGRGGGDSA